MIFLAFMILKTIHHETYHYLFTLWFCCGIVAFGLFIRSKLNVIIKIYFSVFISSLLLFVYSPSFLFSVISLSKYSSNEKDKFLLTTNIYLMKQQAMVDADDSHSKYKIFKKIGLFNKTLAREISFGHTLDSIKLINIIDEKEVTVRGYFKTSNTKTDSVDIITHLGMNINN